MKNRVLVDFDGVLHANVTAQRSAGYIADPPYPGAISWLRRLMDSSDFEPVVLTTLAATLSGEQSVYEWLDKYGLFDNLRPVLAEEDCICRGRGYLKHMRGYGEMWPVSCECVLRAVKQTRALTVTNVVNDAYVILDDRAIRFTGSFPSEQELREFKPWNC